MKLFGLLDDLLGSLVIHFFPNSRIAVETLWERNVYEPVRDGLLAVAERAIHIKDLRRLDKHLLEKIERVCADIGLPTEHETMILLLNEGLINYLPPVQLTESKAFPLTTQGVHDLLTTRFNAPADDSTAVRIDIIERLILNDNRLNTYTRLVTGFLYEAFDEPFSVSLGPGIEHGGYYHFNMTIGREGSPTSKRDYYIKVPAKRILFDMRDLLMLRRVHSVEADAKRIVEEHRFNKRLKAIKEKTTELNDIPL